MARNTVMDMVNRTLVCNHCGDEVPIPCGNVRWATAVMIAFAEAHSDAVHERGITMFMSAPPRVIGQIEPRAPEPSVPVLEAR